MEIIILLQDIVTSASLLKIRKKLGKPSAIDSIPLGMRNQQNDQLPQHQHPSVPMPIILMKKVIGDVAHHQSEGKVCFSN